MARVKLGKKDIFAPTRKATSKPGKKQASKTVRQLTSKPVSQHTGKLVKATFYLKSDQVLKLEEIRLDSMRKGKAKRDKSDLVRQAIDLLVSQYASKPVKRQTS